MKHMNHWFIAAAICIAVGSAWQLDGPEDHQAEWADSHELKELQLTEAGTARRQAAGQKLCEKVRGPNSEARWTVDDDLVCTTRLGLVAVAQ
ncbi:MAG: hypothetical protein V4718_00655 [Pseudomonadota bacterium]